MHLFVSLFAAAHLTMTGIQETKLASSLTSPAARSGFAMTWDADRESVVIYGGRGNDGATFDDTWAWSLNSGWKQLDTSGPGLRYDSQAVYDSERKHVVLFGGQVKGVGRTADTWILENDTWRKVADSGPPARTLHAMAWDDARKQVVLFGGSDENRHLLADTWSWDGTTWTKRKSSGPSARGAHAMTFHDGLSKIVLACGYASNSMDDLWAWNGEAWTQLESKEIPANLHIGFAHDASRDCLVAFGGFGSEGRVDEIWQYDGNNWSHFTTDGVKPEPRAEHEAVYIPGRGVLVFGGVAGHDMADSQRRRVNDLWLFDGKQWTAVPTGGLPEWNTHCPKSGKPVRSDAYFDHNGVRVYFCNHDCATEGSHKPEHWIQRVYGDLRPTLTTQPEHDDHGGTKDKTK